MIKLKDHPPRTTKTGVFLRHFRPQHKQRTIQLVSFWAAIASRVRFDILSIWRQPFGSIDFFRPLAKTEFGLEFWESLIGGGEIEVGASFLKGTNL